MEINGKIKVKIDLKPGAYILEGESGTGKTRLCKFLKKAFANGMNVYGYTYDDYLSKTPIDLENKELFMFDRYDLYNNDTIRKKIVNNKNTIILIDYKTNKIFPAQTAFLEMTENTIEVSQ